MSVSATFTIVASRAINSSCTLGLTISRYLLGVPAVADAEPADLARVLGPALRTIVDPT